MLEIRGVTKVYKTGGLEARALRKVSINFRENEFAAILGPSGSGKTTLLNIIGGLDHYTSGDLIINEVSTRKFHDKDWDAYRNHRIGFVFQSYNLIPHQTILQNVKLALTLSGISKREATRRAKKALKDVGLGEHINKRPGQLSGGQMQRVAIARALVNNPDILLADEPTGALDSETSVQIMNLLAEIAKEKLVVMVTHNPELAEKYATRIITLKDGEITSDSNPYDGKIKTNLDTAEQARRQKKTKMSFLTALSLSLKNLLTKKGRTVLVAFAGSIGIIGIALISAVSTGFQNYIDSIERETLTSYPLSIMRESTDLTGLLLNITGGSGAGTTDGKVRENKVLTSMLGSVSTNDLKSFMRYFEGHRDEIKDDVRLVEYEYNVDPMIYTVDATGKIAKLNPSNLFSSVFGGSNLMSSYSSMTSVFEQYDLENIKNDTHVVAGRYPENYNELVVYLSDPGQISDLLTYSLGFHDTAKLSEMVTKILSGESVEDSEAALELSYEDLLGRDLRLIYATDLYKYNSKYDVYEDMSDDEGYVETAFKDKSEKLEIVGVVAPNDSTFAAGSGVLYLPSLVEHIIKKSSETEIVKKQLADPTVDIFSGTKFGEKTNNFNFEFSDLVSVDSNAIAKAFNVKIDQNAVAAKTTEYMNAISDEITADVSPVKEVLDARLEELKTGLTTAISEKIAEGSFDPTKIEEYVEEFVGEEDFGELETNYLVPAENFAAAFSGLLKLALVGGQDELIDETVESFAVMITEILMKQGILTKVGGLTSYLTNSFANAFSVDETALLSAFKLNFSEDELARVVSAMFNKTESSLATNLSLLGYQDLDDPSHISFYFDSFDGKTRFMEFLDTYNDLMRSYSSEDRIIEYTDTTGVLMSSVKTIVDAVSYVLIAFVSISLVVSSIMIGIITYISVYERTKEIGILRAIGASKRNIANIFNAETFIVGFLSGIFGIVISYILIVPINAVLHHFTGDIPLSAALDPRTAGWLIILSVILTLIGGLIPARSASKKDPVEALRSE
ncbi:ABC transporter ATP-binding protein/permease [Candidatus Saccharibacteria bacterium]|nr:ABC transporter ATP-binding protein/permease [Candidatus Saccharibacteria bacterium]